MNETVRTRMRAGDSRRHPRVRVPSPFPCSYARIGLKKWATPERTGLGIVYDLSEKGARVMSEAHFNLGDQIAISLTLPSQLSSMFVDMAVVRWGKDQTFGLEFETLSQVAVMRLRKFLSRQSVAVN